MSDNSVRASFFTIAVGTILILAALTFKNIRSEKEWMQKVERAIYKASVIYGRTKADCAPEWKELSFDAKMQFIKALIEPVGDKNESQ